MKGSVTAAIDPTQVNRFFDFLSLHRYACDGSNVGVTSVAMEERWWGALAWRAAAAGRSSMFG